MRDFKNTIIVLFLIIAITGGFFGLYYIVLNYLLIDYVHNVEGYQSLSEYYVSMGNHEKGNQYLYLYNFNFVLFISPYVVFELLIELLNRRLVNKQYANYELIKYEYNGLFFFNMILIILSVHLIWFLKLIFNVNYIYVILIICVTSFVFPNIHKYVFRELLNRMGEVKDNDFQKLDLEFKPLKRNKIIRIAFYVFLILSFIPFTYSLFLFSNYQRANPYPETIVLTESSQIKFNICNNYSNLTCREVAVLSLYKLESIEFSLNNESYNMLNENSDYRIRIVYYDKIYYLTNEFFAVEQINNDYVFTIYFKTYLKERNLPLDKYKGIDIDFIDSNNVKLEEQPGFTKFRILLIKYSGGSEVDEFIND